MELGERGGCEGNVPGFELGWLDVSAMGAQKVTNSVD